MDEIPVFKTGAEINIDEKKCIGCRKCVEVCPEDIYKLIKNEQEINPNKQYKSFPVTPEKCILCLSCLEICPTNAISIFGKR
ncbi:MAG: 4Fe-4S dicluster domain-containing protein [Thermoanaerobacteraceae bacterium]